MIQTTEKQVLLIALSAIADAVEVIGGQDRNIRDAMWGVRDLLSKIKDDDLQIDEKQMKPIVTLRKLRYNKTAE